MEREDPEFAPDPTSTDPNMSGNQPAPGSQSNTNPVPVPTPKFGGVSGNCALIGGTPKKDWSGT